jgi:NTE family protein
MPRPAIGAGREDDCPPGQASNAPARGEHDHSPTSGRAPRVRCRIQARAVAARGRPPAVLSVVLLGTAMAFVDATIVNISVPSIVAQFPTAQLSSVSWVLNAYNVVFAAFLIGGGQLADTFGRRRVFSLALCAFTAASALCALAPTLTVLVLARVVQAGGAALLIPSSLAIVLDVYPPERRVRAITLWAAAAAAAAGAGPPLGGLLITASSWRLVFLVNVPVGLLTLVLARAVVPESRRPGARRLPDVLGEAALSLAVAALVLAIVKGEEWGWLSAQVLATLAASCLLGAVFLARCRRDPARTIDPELFKLPSFRLANGATVVFALGFYAYTLGNVLFLTEVWRYSVLQTGLVLMPGPIVAMAVAAVASGPIERFGHRAVIVPGALLWAGGAAYLLATATAHPDLLGTWLPVIVLSGVGAGLTFPAVSGAAVMSVPGERYALASALNAVARQVGAALGVAAIVAILGTPHGNDVLTAFRHGWTFAGTCLLAGGAVCLPLVLRAPVAPARTGREVAEPAAATAGEGR